MFNLVDAQDHVSTFACNNSELLFTLLLIIFLCVLINEIRFIKKQKKRLMGLPIIIRYVRPSISLRLIICMHFDGTGDLGFNSCQ
jgi:hypothetical protein